MAGIKREGEIAVARKTGSWLGTESTADGATGTAADGTTGAAEEVEGRAVRERPRERTGRPREAGSVGGAEVDGSAAIGR